MKNLIIEKEYAKIHELDKVCNHNPDVAESNDNCFRLFRVLPGAIHFQIRSFSRLNQWGKGKPRKMIATVGLYREEIDQVITALQAELDNL